MKAWIATVLAVISFSASAQANGEVLQVRTARIDNQVVLITPDLRLFGVNCRNNDLVFPTATGSIDIETYSIVGARSALPRSTSRPIDGASAALLCGASSNVEFDVVVADQVRVISARAAALDNYTDSVVRTYKFGELTVGVTSNYRLVGLDCKSNLITQLMDLAGAQVSSANLVLQGNDGVLHMKHYNGARLLPAQAAYKPLTNRSVETVCGGGNATHAEYDLTGITATNADLSERISR